MQDMTWRGIRFLLFLVPLVLFSCQGEDESSFEASFEIIPKPHKLFEGNAFFSFGNLLISGPDAFSGESQEFADFCKKNFGLDLAFSVGIEGDTQIEILHTTDGQVQKRRISWILYFETAVVFK